MIARKLCLLSLFSILMFVSCKKSDTLSNDKKIDSKSIEEKFFDNNRTTDPTEKTLVEFLRRINEKEKFVEKTVEKIGYPRWNKAFATRKKNSTTSFQANLEGDSTETFIIPFVSESESSVDAAMIIEASQTDTSFSYKLACDFKNLNNSVNSMTDDAEYLAVFFMVLDNRVFGYKKFQPADPELFKSNGNVASEIELTTDTTFPLQNNLLDYVEFCQDVMVSFPNCPELPGHCQGPGGSCDNCLAICTGNFVYTYCWGEWIEVGGGGTSGGTTGTGGSGTGSSTPPNPCIGGGGTIPIDPPSTEPWQAPVLLQNEINIWNRIQQQDDYDEFSIYLDCQGTSRLGNINFQGTFEHWVIQLDYIYNNAGGTREYKIPFAGPSGTNPGYADIVNKLTNEIFEIKPLNPAGIAAGVAEVNNYVSKANASCTPNPIATNPFFHAGTNYNGGLPKYFPAANPHRVLMAQFNTPGVITYSYESITPSNQPSTAPISIKDQIKELVRRIKDHASSWKEIVSEYLRNHPELVNYIKAAAVGTAVTIIVATIAEDIVTLGAGIFDDWVSLVMAYRIVRYAWAL